MNIFIFYIITVIIIFAVALVIAEEQYGEEGRAEVAGLGFLIAFLWPILVPIVSFGLVIVVSALGLAKGIQFLRGK